MEDKPQTAELKLKNAELSQSGGSVKLRVTKPDAVCQACHNETHRGSMTSWIFRREKHTCTTPGTQQVQLVTGDIETQISHQFGDKYEIMGLLGQGGMGSVYKVKDRDLDAMFAIKVLRTELASEAGAVKRFEQEAIAAAQLTHPNLVAVYKHGVMDQSHGEPFLVMDYVEGESLASLIKREGYLPTQRALEIFIQTCDAVNHAHSKGLLHRDLKPSNVLISKSENGTDFVKLVDFGIAKVLPAADMQNASLTQTGELLGSPLYMSPEQCLGEMLDVRSDIYSLGCLMYEAISGKPPFFAANPIKIIFKHLNEPPSPIRLPLTGHQVPAMLEAMVLKCLEKKPADRYQSVADLTADLLLVQEGKQPTWQKKAARKSSAPFKFKAAAALTLSIATGAVAWFAIDHYKGLQAKAPMPVMATKAMPAVSPKNVLIESCTREIANHPQDPNWYFIRGTAYRETGENEKALSDFTKALTLHPLNTKEILRARAWTYNQLGEFDKSLADCNQAIKLDSKYEEAYSSRSRAYAGLSKLAAAQADADKAVSLNPADGTAYWNRACCEALLGRHTAALDDFNTAFKLEPGQLDILIGRSRSYVKLGEPQKAIDDLSKIIAARPTEYQRLVERADLYNTLGEHEKAMADTSAANALAPSSYTFGTIVRATALGELGRWDEAMKEYQKAAKITPNNERIWKGIGDLWMKHNEYNKAVENYSTALHCFPVYQEAREARAKAYEFLGKKDLARQDLNDAQQWMQHH